MPVRATLSSVLLLGCGSACTDGGMADSRSKPADSGFDSGDSGVDSGDSGTDTVPDSPADTAVDCDEVGMPVALEPRSPLSEGEALCGGYLMGMGVTDVLGFFVAADQGTCPEFGGEAGAVYAVEPGSSEPVWILGVPEATNPFVIETSRTGSGLVGLQRDGEEGIYGGAVDVRLAADGSLVSHLARLDGRLEFMDQFAFADDRLVVGVTVGLDPGEVAVFAPPWEPDAYWRDAAIAVHPQPDGTCCAFGQVVEAAGDVTGDGLEDIVVMGGGAWVMDGELLLTSESPGEADGLPVTGFESRDAVGRVGDLDGDGIGDISASTYATEGVWIQVIAGGSYLELARLYDDVPDGYFGESVTGVGRLEGATTDTMAVVWSAWADMATGGDEVWLVSGPLCGSWPIREVGTQVEIPATAYVTEVEGGPGTFLAIDQSDDGGYLFGSL